MLGEDNKIKERWREYVYKMLNDIVEDVLEDEVKQMYEDGNMMKEPTRQRE